ncbi:hypothetical protein F5X97DRAFT_250789 [Nemania serpens]|nr:hypothetical protein F5X97DRAFT_250789 [Nemania serpens]
MPPSRFRVFHSKFNSLLAVVLGHEHFSDCKVLRLTIGAVCRTLLPFGVSATLRFAKAAGSSSCCVVALMIYPNGIYIERKTAEPTSGVCTHSKHKFHEVRLLPIKLASLYTTYKLQPTWTGWGLIAPIVVFEITNGRSGRYGSLCYMHSSPQTIIAASVSVSRDHNSSLTRLNGP